MNKVKNRFENFSEECKKEKLDTFVDFFWYPM